MTDFDKKFNKTVFIVFGISLFLVFYVTILDLDGFNLFLDCLTLAMTMFIFIWTLRLRYELIGFKDKEEKLKEI